MARVMIQCPDKRVPIFTGIAMDKASFDSSTLTDNQVQCPACGQLHTWSKKDAFLVG